MTTKETPGWLTGITRKRPGVALVLHALLVAANKRGEVTAEDAHCVPVSHPNVRGPAMKALGGCGLRKSHPSTGTTQKSHGHTLWVWTVYDQSKVDAVLRRLSACVGVLQREAVQPTLWDAVAAGTVGQTGGERT